MTFMLSNFYLMEAMKLVIVMYTMNKSHILVNLIIIEYLTIMITANLMSMMSMMAMEIFMVLFFLVLMITESVVGLSLLISIIRTHSNDFLKSSLILKL